MKETEFVAMTTNNKKYLIDITLRNKGESITDFIERSKREDLGEWIDNDGEKQLIS